MFVNDCNAFIIRNQYFHLPLISLFYWDRICLQFSVNKGDRPDGNTSPLHTCVVRSTSGLCHNYKTFSKSSLSVHHTAMETVIYCYVAHPFIRIVNKHFYMSSRHNFTLQFWVFCGFVLCSIPSSDTASS